MTYFLFIIVKDMLLEVSLGEAIDKYSILLIKQEKIKQDAKLTEIKKELTALGDCVRFIQKYPLYFRLLVHVNNQIWELTEFIKSVTADHADFANISNEIFEFNQKRFRLKKIFNLLSESTIKEQKSYTESHCRIVVGDEDSVLAKIPEIHFLLLEYDWISFEPNMEIIKRLFDSPNILHESTLSPTTITNITDIVIPQNVMSITSMTHGIVIPQRTIRSLFLLPAIIYVGSGSLGDFIHQLSVINEIYRKTRRKGILYISEMWCRFAFGVERAYNDTYDLIMDQEYIEDYQIYRGQNYDIDVSAWRKRPDLFHTGTWYRTFNTIYGVEWASHPWLKIQYDDKWANRVLINATFRDITNIDFKAVYEKHGGNDGSLLFITNSEKDYMEFKKTYDIDIPIYMPESLMDACIAIRSCKLFIGGLSAFLTVAHACHSVPHLIGMSSCESEIVRMLELNKIIPTARYTL
jgi:hypothetical protein